MFLAIFLGTGGGLIAAPLLLQHLPGHERLQGVGGALRDALSNSATADPQFAAFYRARGYRPLWVDGRALKPAAAELINVLRAAGQDGLNPKTYHPERLAFLAGQARSGDPAALARAEMALSWAMAAYVGDLRRPPAGAGLAYADPALRLAPTAPGAILEQAASAPSLDAYLTAARRVNPIYDQLRDDLARRDVAHEDLIRANLDRARVLPADFGARFILVNAASQTLWLYRDGQVVGSMRVVVGKPTEQTPVMAGVISYADLNPYWNVPPDLARDSIAPRVLRQGVAYLASQHLEALSDWSGNAAVLDPNTVDWSAVAAGRQVLRVRQRPGPDNMMGSVKFMLPNPLGVYLHDTPRKDLFGAGERDFSAGCVRVQNAGALAQWLFDGPVSPPPPGQAEVRVDLPNPVPVYIVYLTAEPGPHGLTFPSDIYHRDPALLAQMEQRKRAAAA